MKRTPVRGYLRCANCAGRCLGTHIDERGGYVCHECRYDGGVAIRVSPSAPPTSLRALRRLAGMVDDLFITRGAT